MREEGQVVISAISAHPLITLLGCAGFNSTPMQ